MSDFPRRWILSYREIFSLRAQGLDVFVDGELTDHACEVLYEAAKEVVHDSMDIFEMMDWIGEDFAHEKMKDVLRIFCMHFGIDEVRETLNGVDNG